MEKQKQKSNNARYYKVQHSHPLAYEFHAAQQIGHLRIKSANPITKKQNNRCKAKMKASHENRKRMILPLLSKNIYFAYLIVKA